MTLHPEVRISDTASSATTRFTLPPSNSSGLADRVLPESHSLQVEVATRTEKHVS